MFLLGICVFSGSVSLAALCLYTHPHIYDRDRRRISIAAYFLDAARTNGAEGRVYVGTSLFLWMGGKNNVRPESGQPSWLPDTRSKMFCRWIWMDLNSRHSRSETKHGNVWGNGVRLLNLEARAWRDARDAVLHVNTWDIQTPSMKHKCMSRSNTADSWHVI